MGFGVWQLFVFCISGRNLTIVSGFSSTFLSKLCMCRSRRWISGCGRNSGDTRNGRFGRIHRNPETALGKKIYRYLFQTLTLLRAKCIDSFFLIHGILSLTLIPLTCLSRLYLAIHTVLSRIIAPWHHGKQDRPSSIFSLHLFPRSTIGMCGHLAY